MFSTPLHQPTRTARHFVVWCLLLALPIYGFSSTIVQLLGTAHSHGPVAASADPMAGWADARRSPHMARTTVADGHSLRHSHSHPHSHSHERLERHHHDANDETVLSLDGTVTESGASDAGSSSAGSAALVFALAGELRIDPAVASELAWTTAPADPVPSQHGERLERPPNAS